MTWDDFLKILLGGGLGGGLVVFSQAVAQGWTDWRERRQRKRQASTSALLVAIAFEMFAEECSYLGRSLRPLGDPADVVLGRMRLAPLRLPPEPVFSDKVEWIAFKPVLVNKILSFGYQVRERMAALAIYEEPTGEGWKATQAEAIKLGLIAVQLADETRDAYRIEKRGSSSPWIPRDKLQKYLSEINNR